MAGVVGAGRTDLGAALLGEANLSMDMDMDTWRGRTCREGGGREHVRCAVCSVLFEEPSPDFVRLRASEVRAKLAAGRQMDGVMWYSPSSSSSSKYLAFLRCPSVQLSAMPRLIHR